MPRPIDPTRPPATRLALRAAVDGVAIDWLTALLYGLDAARPDPRVAAVAVAPSCSGRRPGLRRLALEPEEVRLVGGVPCASPVRTLVAMGRRGPARCEQALESALRLGLTDAQEIASALPGLGRRRVAHVGVLRQVLAARPAGVAPTESLLETLFVQLARSVPGLGRRGAHGVAGGPVHLGRGGAHPGCHRPATASGTGAGCHRPRPAMSVHLGTPPPLDGRPS